ncbi:hypothetical protein PIB30_033552 [Stylosanthes scabra]|uniref:Uncharacterized protein n=1 Tax=Stylosanthes scabra TaxID=79078 RepID=A0ABU6UCQ2_9FABA|nr:hypothetical protein [Stylosanthes scabra]
MEALYAIVYDIRANRELASNGNSQEKLKGSDSFLMKVFGVLAILTQSLLTLTDSHTRHTYSVTTRRRLPPPPAPGALAPPLSLTSSVAAPFPPVRDSLSALPQPLCPAAAPSSAS